MENRTEFGVRSNYRINPEGQRSELMFQEKKKNTEMKNINKLNQENVSKLKNYTSENPQNNNKGPRVTRQCV